MKEYKKYFIQAIKQYYPEEAGSIIASVESHYQAISMDTRFAVTSANPMDKRLDFCSYFLALIKTLDLRGENFETIRNICLTVVLEYVRPKNRFQHFLKQLPVKLIDTWLARKLIPIFAVKIKRKAHPDGFVAHVVTDKKETYGLGYGFDIIECGICKLFKKHDYYKYASILCEVDEITSSIAGLQLIRTSTIAWGAKTCDFRFKKLEQ